MPDSTIDFETLLAFASGELALQDVQRVQAHLNNHPEDARSVQAYRLARQAVVRDDGVEPTKAALHRARAVFQSQAAPGRMGWLEAVDQLVARLLFDSRIQPAAVRGIATQDRINLTFETASLEVDLQAERLTDDDSVDSPGRWRLIGQVSRTSGNQTIGSGCPVALTAAGTRVPGSQATMDLHGVFELETTGGRHDLHIGLPEGVVVLPQINLE